MPATSSARPASAAVEMRREVEAVEEVEGRADDQRIHERADARALAERGGEHEHDERRDDHDGAEAQARDVDDRLSAARPTGRGRRRRAPSAARPSRTGSSAGRERGEAHAEAAAQGRMGARHRRHHGCAARRYAELAGQAAARPSWSRGKSGHRRAGCWVTPRRGNPTESATERTPPKRPPAVAGKGEKVR